MLLAAQGISLPIMLNRSSHPRSWNRLLLVVLVIGVVSSGCVRRRMTLRTNPPGAVAFVDDQRIGVTPVSTPYTYYGTRKIQLFKDGYEPLTVKQKFSVPWYQYPPLDFITENLWPAEIRDERIVDFEMIPQQLVSHEELLGRAEMLRGNTQSGMIAPLWTPPSSSPSSVLPLPPPSN